MKSRSEKVTKKSTKKDGLGEVKKDDAEQSRRFVETAISLEVDDSAKSFQEFFDSLSTNIKSPSAKRSD